MVSQFYGSIAKSLNAFQTCFKAIFKPCLTALYIATIQSIFSKEKGKTDAFKNGGTLSVCVAIWRNSPSFRGKQLSVIL